MTKRYLATKIAQTTSLSKVDALAAINAMIEAMSIALSRGESITLKGFGTLKRVRRKGKPARDITRKTQIYVPAHYVVKFDAGRDLVQRCNERSDI